MRKRAFIGILVLTIYGISLQAQIAFIDKTLFAGMGGNAINQGLALGDYDGDGREDVYVSALSGSPNRLYRNMGNMIFENVSEQAGVGYAGKSRVSTWGDIDNDGDPDLYVGNRNENDLLYINKGDGTFSEESLQRGISNPANTTSLVMADVNMDGAIDIYISNIQSRNILYINDGSGHFTDHAELAGVNDLAVGMGAVIFDYDLDGDPDIYQCHDAQIPYILYENNGHTSFENIAESAKVNYPGFGMGVDVGDFNLDGYMDMYITNLYDNVLYQNMGDGTFENVAELYGVNDAGMGWGNVFADFDNDRLPDIYVSNDTYFTPLPNILYRNTGTGFEIESYGDPVHSPYGGYATVASDLNDDGKVDILVANNGAPGVQLFQNISDHAHHYIAFHLEGTSSNRDAIGSRIELHTAAGVQYDQVIGSSGFGAHNGRWIHFGLADQTAIEKVLIRWPSGLVEEITSLTVDTKYRIREGEGIISNSNEATHLEQTCKVSTGDQAWILHHDSPIEQLVVLDLAGRAIEADVKLLDYATEISLPDAPFGMFVLFVQSAQQTCISKVIRMGHH